MINRVSVASLYIDHKVSMRATLNRASDTGSIAQSRF
jgi:hypothetical protein